MADFISERKEALVRAASRVVESYAAQRQITLPPAVYGTGNPFSTPHMGNSRQAETFSTGYDGSVTTVAFVTDFSIVGDADIVTA